MSTEIPKTDTQAQNIKMKYSTHTGKTRMQSLAERIEAAQNSIKSIFNKVPPKKPVATLNVGGVIIPIPQNIQNSENNKETDNITETDLVNQELDEDKPKEKINEKELVPSVVKKAQFIIDEIKLVQEKGNYSREEISKEVATLPPRSLIEIALAEVDYKIKYEELKKQLAEKDVYVRKLEDELLKERVELRDLKKNDNENTLKISALEDQLRVLKNKLIGVGYTDKCEYCQEPLPEGCGHSWGDKIVRNYWPKDKNSNYPAGSGNENPIKLNRIETDVNPLWVSQQNNIGLKRTRGLSGSKRQLPPINAELKTTDINMSSNGRYNSNMNGNEELGSNLRRISPMIISTPNNKKPAINMNNFGGVNQKNNY